MIFRRQIIVLLFFCISLTTKAQAPGYMGKQMVIGYGFYINPAITAAVYDYGTKVINTQHEIFLEAAMKRGLSLGLSVKLYNSTYNNTSEVDMSKHFYASSANGYETNIEANGTTYIKARNYAFYLKLFKRNYVAPWGKYFLIGLTVNTRECSYDPDKMKISYWAENPNGVGKQRVTYNDFGPTVQTFRYPDLMMGTGNSRILWNHIVLDYGYNINVMAFTLAVLDAFDEYNPYPEKYIQTNSALRVRGINRFNLFVKLGYLF